jgi:hypothetical protein
MLRNEKSHGNGGDSMKTKKMIGGSLMGAAMLGSMMLSMHVNADAITKPEAISMIESVKVNMLKGFGQKDLNAWKVAAEGEINALYPATPTEIQKKLNIYYGQISTYVKPIKGNGGDKGMPFSVVLPISAETVQDENGNGSWSWTEAIPGDTSVLTITPEEGMKVISVTINDGEAVTPTKNDDGTYTCTFVMGNDIPKVVSTFETEQVAKTLYDLVQSGKVSEAKYGENESLQVGNSYTVDGKTYILMRIADDKGLLLSTNAIAKVGADMSLAKNLRSGDLNDKLIETVSEFKVGADMASIALPVDLTTTGDGSQAYTVVKSGEQYAFAPSATDLGTNFEGKINYWKATNTNGLSYNTWLRSPSGSQLAHYISHEYNPGTVLNNNAGNLLGVRVAFWVNCDE